MRLGKAKKTELGKRFKFLAIAFLVRSDIARLCELKNVHTLFQEGTVDVISSILSDKGKQAWTRSRNRPTSDRRLCLFLFRVINYSPCVIFCFVLIFQSL